MDIDGFILQLHGQNSENLDIQYKAAISLGENLNSPYRNRIIEELISTLNDVKHHGALTRAHAAEALGIACDPSACQALISATKDDYQLTRSYATRALGKLGESNAIPYLIDVLKNDRFFGARAEAAESLGKLCKLLESSKDHKQLDLRKQAFRALIGYYDDRINKDSKRSEDRKIRVLRETTSSLEDLEKPVGLNLIISLQKENIELNEQLEKAKEDNKKLSEILKEIKQKTEHAEMDD